MISMSRRLRRLTLAAVLSAAACAPAAQPVTLVLAPPPPRSPPADLRPRLVVQGFRDDDEGIEISPDGALVAIVSDGLSIVESATGRVRGRFPGCVTAAEFRRDGGALAVLG